VAVVCAEEAPEGGRALLEPLVVVPVLDASVLQRSEEIGENLGKILLDHAEVDLMRGTVKDAGGNVTARLSTLEQDLLAFLAARSQREVHREELQLQVWGHKRALPTRSVDMAISRLRKKIEVDPSNPTVLLTRRGGYRLVTAAHPPAPAPSIGQPIPSFFGRQALLQELGQLLLQNSLVTLVAPPGVGKTRLSAEYAQQQPRVWTAELTTCGTEEEVLMQVGAAIRLDLAVTGPSSRELASRLGRALSSLGPGLLLLDNAEQVQPVVAALLPDWLRAAPRLRILVTSQRSLGIPEEAIREVVPLSDEEAEALFLDRVRRVGGTVDPAAEALLPEVIELLDGLPLAIELAAGRLRSMPLADLRSRLRRRRLSTGPIRPIRRGDLGGAIAASWELLTPEMQACLTDLALFRSPFSYADVEEVLGEEEAAPFEALLDRSLVQRSGGHYRLLSSIREFAQLQGKPRAAAEARHAIWARGLVNRLLPQVETAAAREAIQELASREADLVAALPGLPPEGQIEIGEALQELYTAHSAVERRLDLAERLILATKDESPLLRGRALQMKGMAQLFLPDRGVAALAEASELLRGDPTLHATVLVRRAAGAHRRGHLREAFELGGQARKVAPPRTAIYAQAVCLQDVMGHLLGDPGKSDKDRVRDCEQAVAMVMNMGRIRDATVCMLRLSTILHNIGDRRRSRKAREKTLALSRLVPDTRMQGLAMHSMAMSMSHDGEFEEAIQMSQTGMELVACASTERGWRWMMQYHAMLLCDAGRMEEAENTFEESRLWALGNVQPHDLTHAYEGLAVVMLLQQRPREALAYAQTGLQSDHVRDDHIMLADLRMQAGLALHQLGSPTEAWEEYAKIQLSELHGHQRMMLLGRRLLAAMELGTPEQVSLRQALEEALTGPDFPGIEGMTLLLTALKQPGDLLRDIALNRSSPRAPAWVRMLAITAVQRFLEGGGREG
jgi:tetratricopeptide (TPR) repeat protein/DNA-binding winged helix-turn-helix (wHTH) protein